MASQRTSMMLQNFRYKLKLNWLISLVHNQRQFEIEISSQSPSITLLLFLDNLSIFLFYSPGPSHWQTQHFKSQISASLNGGEHAFKALTSPAHSWDMARRALKIPRVFIYDAVLLEFKTRQFKHPWYSRNIVDQRKNRPAPTLEENFQEK